MLVSWKVKLITEVWKITSINFTNRLKNMTKNAFEAVIDSFELNLTKWNFNCYEHEGVLNDF